MSDNADLDFEQVDSSGEEEVLQVNLGDFQTPPMPEELKALTPREKTSAVVYENETPTDRLMRLALEGNNIDALEKLIALKQSEEDRRIAEEQRQAKIRFDKDFAKMQTEFKPIKRTKSNKQYNRRNKFKTVGDISGCLIVACGIIYKTILGLITSD